MPGRGRPFPKGHRAPGRKKGVPNKVTVEVREAARALIEDEDYLESLAIRLKRGTAGAMEPLLWQYAYGKPRDAEGEGPGAVAETLRVIFGGRHKPAEPEPSPPDA